MERRLTLKQVETGAGLSATHLSEIERGRTSPTVGALLRIARALGKHPAFFVEPRELPEISGSAGLDGTFEIAAGASARPLSSGIAGGRLHPYSLKLRSSPHGWAPPEMRGEVLYFVTSGSVEATLRGAPRVLSAGDAIHARVAVPLRLRAAERADAELIAVFTHPLDRSKGSDRSDSSAGVEVAAGVAEGYDLPPAELGRRIKMFRVSKGLTLKDLEERGGVSATHVSEIERGRASPTLGALGRIALGLGVRAADLVEPSTLPESAIGLASERGQITTRWGLAQLQSLVSPIRSSKINAALVTLPIGREPAYSHTHGGEEWVMVISGQAALEFGSERHTLRPGETIHFRGEILHAYVNSWSSPAVLLSVCRSPVTF